MASHYSVLGGQYWKCRRILQQVAFKMQTFRDCFLYFFVVDLPLPHLEILWYLCLQIYNGGLDLGLEVVLLDLLSV